MRFRDKSNIEKQNQEILFVLKILNISNIINLHITMSHGFLRYCLLTAINNVDDAGLRPQLIVVCWTEAEPIFSSRCSNIASLKLQTHQTIGNAFLYTASATTIKQEWVFMSNQHKELFSSFAPWLCMYLVFYLPRWLGIRTKIVQQLISDATTYFLAVKYPN